MKIHDKEALVMTIRCGSNCIGNMVYDKTRSRYM